MPTGELVGTYYSNDPAQILKITYSPDGTMLAGRKLTSPDTIVVWDTTTGQILHTLQDRDLSVYTLTFSPDSNLILSGGGDGILRLWDSHTGKAIKKIRINFWVSDVAFSPDGQYYAAGGHEDDDYTVIWHISGKLVKTLKAESERGGVNSITFGPNGDLIFTGNQNGHLRIYDYQNGKLLKEFKGIGWNISSMAFSPDGHILATGSHDGNIRFWSLEGLAAQRPTSTPQANEKIISNFETLPPDQYIVYSDEHPGMKIISSDGKVQGQLTYVETGSAKTGDGRIIQLNGDIGSTMNFLTGTTTKFPIGGEISPNMEMVARRGCKDGRGIGITYLETGEEICINLPVGINSSEGVSYPRWSPDGRWLAFFRFSEEYLRSIPRATDGLYLMDTSCLASSETCHGNMKGPYRLNNPANLSVQDYYDWSPDSRYLVAKTRDYHLAVFNLQNELFSVVDSDGGSGIFVISPDSKWIAYGDGRKGLVLIPITGGAETRLLEGNEFIMVHSWLTGPILSVDKSFTITAAGNNLNLRLAPSLASTSIKKLYMNDLITVLDGPVQADGYTWWRVRVEEENLEGWVVEFFGWYEKHQQ